MAEGSESSLTDNRSQALVDDQYQMVGLAGFFSAGAVFFLIGIRDNDIMTSVASAAWMAGCVAWGIPLRRAMANR